MTPNLPLFRKTLDGKTYILLMSYTQNSGNITFFWKLGIRGQTDSYGFPKFSPESTPHNRTIVFDRDFPEAIKKWSSKIILRREFN